MWALESFTYESSRLTAKHADYLLQKSRYFGAVPFRTRPSLLGGFRRLVGAARIPTTHHCYHVCEVIHFANWAEAEGLARRDLNLDALDRLGRQMTERKALRHPSLERRYVESGR